MRPDPVVQLPPALDQDLGLQERVEDLPVQEFIPQFAVEKFHVPVLPGATRLYEERPDAQPLEPFPHRRRRKLRTVVRADIGRGTPLQKELREPVLRRQLDPSDM